MLINYAKNNIIPPLESIFEYADVNFVDEEGNTALFYAIENNNLNFIVLLLENGANVNLQNNS